MKICRFDDNRIGLVKAGAIYDASAVLAQLPDFRWPLPLGDALIARLPELAPQLEAAARDASPIPLAAAQLLSPVANPSKIIAAPVNYAKHMQELASDASLHHGTEVKPIQSLGLFLKAVSSLVGAGEGVKLRFAERVTEHEVELAVVVGRRAERVPRARALDYVAGYAVGLDMTLRGSELRSLRKSLDSYTVLGPWLTTADEIADPGKLGLRLRVNGEPRQESNTRNLVFDVPRLIELASSFYTLLPGDVIMTGTPEGVAPVAHGDRIEAEIDEIGTMTVGVGTA
jgi:2-keto-4-pentenoate hydratase/2-oxohepta-3-ene-1,7-dioic acid hydratase in catechol pathway